MDGVPRLVATDVGQEIPPNPGPRVRRALRLELLAGAVPVGGARRHALAVPQALAPVHLVTAEGSGPARQLSEPERCDFGTKKKDEK